MGMFKRHRPIVTECGCSHRNTLSNDSTIDSSPNPENFKILNSQKIGDLFVSVVKYPDATNFEGMKVLVTSFDPKKKSAIDPHFEKDSGIIARFEPTISGIRNAQKFANMLSREKN
jgi:hypothetical protein